MRTKFGYAVTCHKAQGGEWSHVFVACQTHHGPRSADYFRWLYTAMTRAREKLYLISPPEIRIQLAGPALWPAQDPLNSTISKSAASKDGDSPLEAFRQGVLTAVRQILSGTGIELEDVAHHQYQEAIYLRRGNDSARVNVIYNKELRISAVNPLGQNPFSNELRALLVPLVDRTSATLSQQAAGSGATDPATPSRPFLKSFHERLLPLLDARQIRVTALREQAWSQRYSFARDSETAVVDIFYDGKDNFTKCLPIKPAASSVRPGSLLHDVFHVVTSEIVP